MRFRFRSSRRSSMVLSQTSVSRTHVLGPGPQGWPNRSVPRRMWENHFGTVEFDAYKVWNERRDPAGWLTCWNTNNTSWTPLFTTSDVHLRK